MMLSYVLALIKPIVRKKEGQAMVEYGLIVALIAVVVIAALVILGPRIRDLFQGVADELPSAGT